MMVRAFYFLLFGTLIQLLLYLHFNNTAGKTEVYISKKPEIEKWDGKIKGPVYTKGMQIVDSRNMPVTIKGINYDELVPTNYIYVTPDFSGVPDYCKGWSNPPVAIDLNQLSDFGFNTIRLPIYWSNLETESPDIDENGVWRHNWNAPYVEAIDKLISESSKYGISVILDLHQYYWSSAFRDIKSEQGMICGGTGFPAWLYPASTKVSFEQAKCDFFKGIKYSSSPINPREGFMEVWKFLSERYSNNPQVIGADIINEPWWEKDVCSAEDMNLGDFYTDAAEVIRKNNPDIMLILEDSQDNEENIFAIKESIPFQNWIYSFHLYTGNFNPDGFNRIDKFYNRAKKWNVPLFVGEFDAFGASVNNSRTDLLWKNELSDLMKYMKEREVNWAFWSYSGYYSIISPDTNNLKKDLSEALKIGI